MSRLGALPGPNGSSPVCAVPIGTADSGRSLGLGSSRAVPSTTPRSTGLVGEGARLVPVYTVPSVLMVEPVGTLTGLARTVVISGTPPSCFRLLCLAQDRHLSEAAAIPELAKKEVSRKSRSVRVWRRLAPLESRTDTTRVQNCWNRSCASDRPSLSNIDRLSAFTSSLSSKPIMLASTCTLWSAILWAHVWMSLVTRKATLRSSATSRFSAL
mmetsp:Transcript_1198/g.2648  ORF Transcript_1198/g.2648 Transcript_1198/m.2648 type:complete len:213 (+) Transcript_1198:388-1026(+)